MALRVDRISLLDFDIALPIGGQRSKTKPRGTRYYIPPEQIRCKPAHPTLDLFALGALLYEAASGQLAFDIDTDDNTSESGNRPRQYRQLGEPIPSIAHLVPHIVPALAAVIDGLLAREPNRRPPSADAVITLLEDATPPAMHGVWPPWVTDAIVRTPTTPRQRHPKDLWTTATSSPHRPT